MVIIIIIFIISSHHPNLVYSLWCVCGGGGVGSMKDRIVDRIYEAFQAAAAGKPEVPLNYAVRIATGHTNMPNKLVRMYMDSMEAMKMIENDGRTVWLTQDHGPRPQRPDEWEAQRKKDLKAQKRAERETKARMHEIRKAERCRKRAKRGK